MKKIFVLVAFAISTLLLLRSEPSHSGQSNSEFTVAYKTAWSNGVDPRLQVQAPTPGSISRAYMPQFGGVALKVSINKTDDFSRVANGTPRAELAFLSLPPIENGKEYQVNWSTMIPPNYRLDSLQPEIISQIHQSSAALGSPPFSLMINGQQYQVDVRGGPGTPSRSFLFGTPGVDEGRVVTWSLYYRPDHNGPSAVTDLYKDGVLVVHSVGYPNAYDNEQQAYWKVGVYKWWWETRPSDVTQRTMYYGDVTLGSRVVNQFLPVTWSDPQTLGLASSYFNSYSFDWQNGIDPSIGTFSSTPTDVAVVADPSVPARKAVRVRMTSSENSSAASTEVTQKGLTFEKPLTFAQGHDYLIRWSTYLPQQFPPRFSATIMQIYSGLSVNVAPVSLGIDAGNYIFVEQGGNPRQQRPLFQLCCASADQGKWTYWALRYLPDSTGKHASTQLWKDGVLVYASRGEPNANAGDGGAYLRVGMYDSVRDTPMITGGATLLFGPVAVGQR